MQPNNDMFIDDGLISLLYESKTTDTFVYKTENDGTLGSKKDFNLLGAFPWQVRLEVWR